MVNARDEGDPYVRHVVELGFDLNSGIVVIFNDQHFHGADAINFLSLIGSTSSFMNRLNVYLFSSKFISRALYPFFVFVRRILLFIRGKTVIRPKQSIHTKIITDNSSTLPLIFYKRYSNREYSNDCVSFQGKLSITYSRYFKCISFLLKPSNALILREGKNIPVRVKFRSDEHSNKIFMSRTLYFPDQEVQFNSYCVFDSHGHMIEYMKFNLGWKCLLKSSENTINLLHKGYYFNLLGIKILTPISFILGKCSAEETEIDNDSYSMSMKLTHSLFGEIYHYYGKFEIVSKDEE